MGTSITNFAYGPACLAELPGASQAITHVIAVGAHVEIGWAGILAAISGSDAASAVTLLRQLKGVGNHEKAVLAVGKQRLQPDDFLILQAAAKVFKAHRDRRNDFAHSIWARSQSIPAAVFQVHPDKMVARLIWSPPQDRPVQLSDVAVVVEDKDIYRAAEFEAAVKEADEAVTIITAAEHYFSIRYRCERTDATNRQAASMLSLLRGRPAFDAELKRLEASQKNSNGRAKAATTAPIVEFSLNYRRPDGTFVAIVRDLPYHVTPDDPLFARCVHEASRLGDELPVEPPPQRCSV